MDKRHQTEGFGKQKPRQDQVRAKPHHVLQPEQQDGESRAAHRAGAQVIALEPACDAIDHLQGRPGVP